MIGPNSSTQCQNKSKHSISFDNIATLLPSFRSGPLAHIWSGTIVADGICSTSREKLKVGKGHMRMKQKEGI